MNLTAADIVIHYDPWWNVAVQNQQRPCTPYRQKNVVTVYKLVSQGTIEEKIIDIQEKKKKLAEQVLEGEGMDSVVFTKEENHGTSRLIKKHKSLNYNYYKSNSMTFCIKIT